MGRGQSLFFVLCLSTELVRWFDPPSPIFFLCVTTAELGPKSNLGRLNNVMKNIGRNVKNSAVVAVERIGAGIHGKVLCVCFFFFMLECDDVCQACVSALTPPSHAHPPFFLVSFSARRRRPGVLQAGGVGAVFRVPGVRLVVCARAGPDG